MDYIKPQYGFIIISILKDGMELFIYYSKLQLRHRLSMRMDK